MYRIATLPFIEVADDTQGVILTPGYDEVIFYDHPLVPLTPIKNPSDLRFAPNLLEMDSLSCLVASFMLITVLNSTKTLWTKRLSRSRLGRRMKFLEQNLAIFYFGCNIEG